MIKTKISVTNNNGSGQVLASEQRLSTRLKREKLSILQGESNRFRKVAWVLFIWNTRGIGLDPSHCTFNLFVPTVLVFIICDNFQIQFYYLKSSLVGANVGSRYYTYNKIHVSYVSIKLNLKSSTFNNQYFPVVQSNKTIE